MSWSTSSDRRRRWRRRRAAGAPSVDGSRSCRGRRPARRAAGPSGPGPAPGRGRRACARPRRARRSARSTRWPMPSSSTARSTAAVPDDAGRGRRGRPAGATIAGASAATSRLPRTSRSSNSSTALERAHEPEPGTLVRRETVEGATVEHRRAPVHGVNPDTASMHVVLPAPFGPMRPTSAPAGDVERDVVDRADAAVAHGQLARCAAITVPRAPAGAARAARSSRRTRTSPPSSERTTPRTWGSPPSSPGVRVDLELEAGHRQRTQRSCLARR